MYVHMYDCTLYVHMCMCMHKIMYIRMYIPCNCVILKETPGTCLVHPLSTRMVI